MHTTSSTQQAQAESLFGAAALANKNIHNTTSGQPKPAALAFLSLNQASQTAQKITHRAFKQLERHALENLKPAYLQATRLKNKQALKAGVSQVAGFLFPRNRAPAVFYSLQSYPFF